MILQKNILLYNRGVIISLPLLIITSAIFLFHPSGGLFFLIPAIAAIAGIMILQKIRTSIISQHQGEFEGFEERINILTKNIEAKKEILKSLPGKTKRVSFLFDISKSLIELTDPEDIFNSLIQILETLFPDADSILLFSFNKEDGSLSLTRALKSKTNTIKEKKGNSLDKWVLHHNRSLLIDDIVKDFRFDSSKLLAYEERKAHSFILSPLSIDHKFLGLARIESKPAGVFSLDDLRFLRNVCDLGAVVIERSILFRRIQELATKDSLTSLFVRNYFAEHLSRELSWAQRQKKSLGLIMLDIDNFKEINDTYGHVVGDLVLVKLAAILKKTATGRGIASRFGGEEFTVLLLESSRKELIACAESIRKAVADTNLVFRRKKIQFTVSLGVASYPESAETPLGLIEEADKFLYKAKREGKNKTCYSG